MTLFKQGFNWFYRNHKSRVYVPFLAHEFDVSSHLNPNADETHIRHGHSRENWAVTHYLALHLLSRKITAPTVFSRLT
jgi:hypothetical protein